MAKIKGMSIFAKTGLLAVCLFGVISVLATTLTAYTLYTRMTAEFTSKGTAIAQAVASSSQEILLNRDAATVQAPLISIWILKESRMSLFWTHKES